MWANRVAVPDDDVGELTGRDHTNLEGGSVVAGVGEGRPPPHGLGLTVLPDRALDIDVPAQGRASAQCVDNLPAGLDDRLAGGAPD